MTIDEAIAHEKIDSEPCSILCTHTTNRNDCIECRAYHKQLAEWLEELKQYRAIGTVNECREAVEKMKPKKTAIEAIKVHICPVCGSSGIYDYCGNCGQRVQMLSD